MTMLDAVQCASRAEYASDARGEFRVLIKQRDVKGVCER